jgi:hypothetical protein
MAVTVTKYEVELQRLQTIDWMGKNTVTTMISEIGVELNCFENVHHLVSWVRLSLRTNKCAGEKKVSESCTEINMNNRH